MGYTNYITHLLPFTDQEWNTFTDACKHLQEIAEYNHPKLLEWFFNDDAIGFNSANIETAFIERKGTDWDFCKTNRDKADIWVKALYAIARLMKGCKQSADGRLDEFGKKYYDIAKYCMKLANKPTEQV